jgi:hypothetical protein
MTNINTPEAFNCIHIRLKTEQRHIQMNHHFANVYLALIEISFSVTQSTYVLCKLSTREIGKTSNMYARHRVGRVLSVSPVVGIGTPPTP